MLKKFLTILLALTVFIASSSSSAQANKKVFRKIDTDGDGIPDTYYVYEGEEACPTGDSIKKKQEVGQLFKKPKPKIEKDRFLWKDVSYGLRDRDLRFVALDPQNPEVVYLGSSDAVFKTIDGGRHWREMLTIREAKRVVNFIAIDPKDSKAVYIATESGLYKTINAGKSWRDILKWVTEKERNVQSIAIDFSDTRRIYAGTSHGLFLTNDGGKTWKKVPGRVTDSWITFIALHPSKKDTFYVATKEGVFKTIDGGRTWAKVFVTAYEEEEVTCATYETYTECANAGCYWYDDACHAKEGGEEEVSEEVQCIGIDPSNPQRVYLGAHNGFFATNNGGETWKKGIEEGLTNTNIRSLLVSSGDVMLYAATRKGVFKFSKKRNRWQELYAGMTTRNIRFIALDTIKNILWAATNRGIFKSERR